MAFIFKQKKKKKEKREQKIEANYHVCGSNIRTTSDMKFNAKNLQLCVGYKTMADANILMLISICITRIE